MHHGKGFEYLRKIVQVPIRVPAILRATLRKGLENLIHRYGVSFDSDEEMRYEMLVEDPCIFSLTNMRDVKRLVNLFMFRYSGLRNDIDPVDMLALCAIEVSEPRLYEWVADNPYTIFHGGSFSGNPRGS